MDYLLKASAIIALFYGFYKLILQRETFFQSTRWFLLIGLFSALLIPLLVIPIYVEQTVAFTGDFVIVDATETVIQQKSTDWLYVLKLIYFGGILFFGTKFILNLLSLTQLLSSHKKKKIAAFNFVETSLETTPFSFFNFIVFNPNHFKKEELAQIITHEKVHVKQFHSVDILISQIATVLFWFNPFMWLFKKEIQQNLEFIADDIAQQKTNCEKSYQKLLLKTSLSQNQLVLTNNFYNSLIKKRIIMLHKNRSKSTNQWKYALILPLIVSFVFTFNTKVVAQSKIVEKVVILEENTQLFIISKDSKTSDFKKIKNRFSKEGVTANFKNIKRNSNGEIIGINISVKSKQSNANYSTSSDSPIKPISISFDNKGDNISIGNSNMHHGEDIFFVSEGGEHKVHSTKEGNSFVFITDDENIHKDKDRNHMIIDIDEDGDHGKYKIIEIKGDDIKSDETIIWISKNGKESKKHKTTKTTIELIEEGDKVFRFNSGDKNATPLIYLDGKEISKEKMGKLDNNSIEKMNVIKGSDKAIEKYGKKAKDGVILITTKGKK